MKYDCLIVEGGGFKTAFTAGVLDSFITAGYKDFETLIGVSGGAVAVSYFLSDQYRYCINAMKILAKDNQFANYKRAFGDKGYLDIDYLATVASEKVPLRLDLACQSAADKKVFFVATNKKNGNANYLQPCIETWVQTVIASSTLPFATKGVHQLNEKSYFDGGWSDPLPVRWAYKNGARKILVLRTKPKYLKVKQSWADYFGSKYFKATPKLAKIFESAFDNYNKTTEFMMNPPKDLKISQIAPKKLLKSGTYSYSNKTLMLDYRYGLDKGMNHLNKF